MVRAPDRSVCAANGTTRQVVPGRAILPGDVRERLRDQKFQTVPPPAPETGLQVVTGILILTV